MARVEPEHQAGLARVDPAGQVGSAQAQLEAQAGSARVDSARRVDMAQVGSAWVRALWVWSGPARASTGQGLLDEWEAAPA